MIFQIADIEKVLGFDFSGNIPPSDIDGIVTDSRGDCRNKMFVALTGENFDGHDFLTAAVRSGAAALCIDESKCDNLNGCADVAVIAVKDTLKAYQQLAAYHKARLAKNHLQCVAVTGSMGKTSCKEMCASILRAAVGAEHVLATAANTNNQIGVAQNLLRLTENHRYCVIEMGSNHPGEIEPLSRCAKPDVALVTSIGPCHLEFFKNLNGVAREKSKIFKGLTRSGTAIIPHHAAQLDILSAAASNRHILTFGSAGADIVLEYLSSGLTGCSIRLSSEIFDFDEIITLPVSGRHQAVNAAAAAAAALVLGINHHHIVKGLGKFTLPGMRMRIAEHGTVTWINDAYNASPESMASALKWLAENVRDKSKVILALGDMLELGRGAPEAHRQVLKLAIELFPDQKMFLFGKEMRSAGEKLLINAKLFNNADNEARQCVLDCLENGSIIFLKASRGIKLENLEPSQ